MIADGPINDLSATEKVGYIKTPPCAPYLSKQRRRSWAGCVPGSERRCFLLVRAGHIRGTPGTSVLPIFLVGTPGPALSAARYPAH